MTSPRKVSSSSSRKVLQSTILPFSETSTTFFSSPPSDHEVVSVMWNAKNLCSTVELADDAEETCWMFMLRVWRFGGGVGFEIRRSTISRLLEDDKAIENGVFFGSPTVV
ncbi:hypothetical protein KFK09_028205 [Dendrobium nobile]|uniref:Uncharacterized protein n=1 Tax=Dendrobium nobile TaxID=94219 RepID=A0A8T3A102_DENNO|nr:hypothetical protein KFK09_028205 [Dendrobium nobile]